MSSQVSAEAEVVITDQGQFVGFCRSDLGWGLHWGIATEHGPRTLARTPRPLRWTSYAGAVPAGSSASAFDSVTRIGADLEATADFVDHQQSRWGVRARVRADAPGFTLEVTWSKLSGAASDVALQVVAVPSVAPGDAWRLVPGVLYGDNPTDVTVDRLHYPQLSAEEMTQLGVAGKPVRVTTDIPRLDASTGHRLEMLGRDTTTSELGVLDPTHAAGFFFGTSPESHLGPVGLGVHADPVTAEHELSWSLPGVRPRRYTMCAWEPSVDRAATITAGAQVQASFFVHSVPADGVPTFLDAFRDVQDRHARGHRVASRLPWSAATTLIRRKYDEHNWTDDPGIYRRRFGPQPVPCSTHLQMGWMDGTSTVLALLPGGGVTRERAEQMLGFILRGQASTGLCYEGWDGERWVTHYPGGRPDAPGTLIRRTTDSLFFALRIEASHAATLPAALLTGLREFIRRGLTALHELWVREHDLGLLVDPESAALIWRGTANGALAPAVLAVGAARLDRPDWLDAAVEIADSYAEFVERGDAYGGPGDILCAADDESVAGLAESFVTLYEHTREPRFLQRAVDAANLLATWQLARAVPYPAGSFLGDLGIDAFGAMSASTQNLVGTPGLCISSGEFLLRLYELTDDVRHLRALEAILRVMPQMIVTEPGQWEHLPVGSATEILSFSDAHAPFGETRIFEATWVQQALCLAHAEIPGVYVDLGRDLAIAFDHVDIALDSHGLLLRNPTAHDAAVRVRVRGRSDVTCQVPARGEHRIDTQEMSAP